MEMANESGLMHNIEFRLFAVTVGYLPRVNESQFCIQMIRWMKNLE